MLLPMNAVCMFEFDGMSYSKVYTCVIHQFSKYNDSYLVICLMYII